MKITTKVLLLDDDGQRFFGDGPYQLLLGLEKTGSLRQAAAEMGMAYSKALRLVKQAEKGLGYALTARYISRERLFETPLQCCNSDLRAMMKPKPGTP